ncbi:nucleoside 2-deoxyribosyltransferase [Schizosaccharomyces osmophilus]|uniref:Nucleoside 2-deoxyribosyltransferase n=1 Tax=Schizosaccharomyces osmophilus TaxID=2545709 RepID=A0AAE9WEI2_9SCHI|nr:nucleoside 2-deoxyribosyltransferase [Schizosaccharomyces osmophilus]WBW74921.1 nucleoside 2-deoxyribosyltransferase [Schizosaccharomyces osmophilus]
MECFALLGSYKTQTELLGIAGTRYQRIVFFVNDSSEQQRFFENKKKRKETPIDCSICEKKVMTLPAVSQPKVYLAGDLVFRPDAYAIFEELKAICRQVGVVGMAPFDGQEEVEDMEPGIATSLAIATLDRNLMDVCDAGIFCLDPFRRAPDMDPGTAVELGYMSAQGKPLAGFTVDGRTYPDKVQAYRKNAWDDELVPRASKGGSGSLEDADGLIVHSEGMVQNVMVEGFIRMSGGIVSIHTSIHEAFRIAITALVQELAQRAKQA